MDRDRPEYDVLNAYRLDRIGRCLSYVKERSRFYREYYRDAGSIPTWQDFHALPFTEPSHLRKAPSDFLCVRPGEVRRIVTLRTSGTNGDEKRVFFSSQDCERAAEYYYRSMCIFTSESDRAAVFFPGERPDSIGDLIRRGLERVGCPYFEYGFPRDTESAARFILKNRITVLFSMPMPLLRLADSAYADEIREKGLLSKCLISADTVTETMVQRIGRALGSAVYEHYGMTETCFGGGIFCGSLYGYHLRDREMLFEIVDPVSGRPVEDGVYGEVVLTTFSHEAMPLIRYRTGDVARFLPEPCPCGHPYPVMERILCRLDDVLVWENGPKLTVPEIGAQLMDLCSFSDIGYTLEAGGGRLLIRLSDPSLPLSALSERFKRTAIAAVLMKNDISFSFVHGGSASENGPAMHKHSLIRL